MRRMPRIAAASLTRPRRFAALAATVAILAVATLLAPQAAASVGALQDHTAQPQGAHAADGESGAEAHGESWGAIVSRLANFAILAGGLWYFLRSPIGRYLGGRADRIQGDLVTAARLRSEATARLAQIEEQMRLLPGELERLRARGAEEIKAEEARILQAATAERGRLVEQVRRDIDLHVQAMRRDLTRLAADLAVRAAEARIEASITDDDQRRLIGRYVSQVQAVHE